MGGMRGEVGAGRKGRWGNDFNKVLLLTTLDVYEKHE